MPSEPQKSWILEPQSRGDGAVVSRGLGRRERELLESLRCYAAVGRDLGLTWNAGGSFNRKHLIMDDHRITLFELGQIIEVRRLRRDTGMSAAVLSRTLKALERKELLFLYAANLEERHDCCCRSDPAVKFASLTLKGREMVNALSANKSKDTKLALKQDEQTITQNRITTNLALKEDDVSDAWCGWCPQ
jgi:hypothetical protein